MNKKFLFAILFVLIASLLIASAIALAKTDLARLEIVNKTDQTVAMSLTAEKAFYYLTVAPNSTRIFTVERLVYDRTTWSCDKSDGGSVDMETYVKLVFTPCGGDAPNQGEPTHEKVHIPDTPWGDAWRYR